MDLQTLKTFKAVADSGSFSKAAEALFLTQPAISKRIAQLESQLDTQLFDRIGHQTHLTEAGKILLPRVNKILIELRDIQHEIHNLSGHISGKLQLATSHHIGLHRLPPILQAFTKHHPQVELDLQFMDSEMASQKVETGEIELAIITLPAHQSMMLNTLPVWNDPLVFVHAKNAGLNLEPGNEIEGLAQTSAILPSRNTVTRKLIEQHFANYRLSLNIAMETNYLETIKKMVEIGLGWSALPRIMLSDNLQPIQLPEIHIARSLGVVTHAKRSISNAANAMIDLLQSEFNGSSHNHHG